MGGQDKGARNPLRARRMFQRSAVGQGTSYGDGMVYDDLNDVISIDLGVDPGLEFVLGKLEVFVNPNAGIEKLAAGLGIKLDINPALALSSNGLTVDLRDTTPCLEIDPTGIGAIVKSDGGLQRTADGLALSNASGTAFPTTGLFTGKQFFRTDLVQMFIYDGTTWVGDIYTITFGLNTGSFAPTGTNQLRPMASVSNTRPHGYPNLVDSKVVGVQMLAGGSWSGTINVYHGSTIIHAQSVSSSRGFNADVDINTDSSATNGFSVEIVITSGLAYDPICILLLRRRIDP